jgi:hypothetical protein
MNNNYLTEDEIDTMVGKIMIRLVGEIHKLYNIELEYEKAITIKDRINETIIDMKRENLIANMVNRREK